MKSLLQRFSEATAPDLFLILPLFLQAPSFPMNSVFPLWSWGEFSFAENKEG